MSVHALENWQIVAGCSSGERRPSALKPLTPQRALVTPESWIEMVLRDLLRLRRDGLAEWPTENLDRQEKGIRAPHGVQQSRFRMSLARC